MHHSDSHDGRVILSIHLFQNRDVTRDRGFGIGLTNLYTITHKQSFATAIVFAAFSISGANAADPAPNDGRTANREALNGVIYTSITERRASFPGQLAQATIVNPGSDLQQKHSSDPSGRSTLAIANRQNGDSWLEANTSGNRNDDAFDYTSSRAKVTWLVAKKCGWLCMRVRF